MMKKVLMTLMLATLAVMNAIAQGKYVVPATLKPTTSWVVLNDNDPVPNCFAWYGFLNGSMPTVTATTSLKGYEAYIQGVENAKSDGSGSAFFFRTMIDGIMAVTMKIGSNKKLYVLESPNGYDYTPVEGFNGKSVSYGFDGTYSFPVKESYLYHIYAVGTKIGIYGFELRKLEKTFNGFYIERKNGSKVGYMFTDKPKLSYSGSNMIVKAGKAEAEFKVTDVKRICFDEDVSAITTDISEAVSNGQGELLQVVNDGASLQGFAPASVVTVYDAGGRMVSKLKTDAGGQATVSLAGLPSGLYIIKAGKNVLKLKH